jgi:hypothetical protein
LLFQVVSSAFGFAAIGSLLNRNAMGTGRSNEDDGDGNKAHHAKIFHV